MIQSISTYVYLWTWQLLLLLLQQQSHSMQVENGLKKLQDIRKFRAKAWVINLKNEYYILPYIEYWKEKQVLHSRLWEKYTTILLDLEIFLSSMKLKFWQDLLGQWMLDTIYTKWSWLNIWYVSAWQAFGVNNLSNIFNIEYKIIRYFIICITNTLFLCPYINFFVLQWETPFL